MNNQEAINELMDYIAEDDKTTISIETARIAITALEKQIAKEPVLCMNEKSGMFVDYADGHGEYKVQINNWWRCPHCHSIVGQRVIVHEYAHDHRKEKYCEKCGQLIDWT